MSLARQEATQVIRLRHIPVAVAILVGVPAAAQDGPEIYFQPGVTTESFTGDVGRFASASIGVSATQGIQLDVVGAYLTLGTNYHLTNQPPPPYTRGLQTFNINAGLRLRVPTDPIEPAIGIEYSNLGVVSNALNRFTGDQLSFNGIGALLAARWRVAPPFYVELSTTTRYYVDMLNPTASVGVSVAIGLFGNP